MKLLRKLLDSIPMYRLMFMALSGLAGVTLLLSAVGIFDYSSFTTLTASLIFLLVLCHYSNLLLAKLYKVDPNFGSALITATILFFVLASPDKPYEWIGLAFAALVAMASKYIITWRSAHIFNPAAFGVLAVSLLGVGSGAWWIANESLLIPMLVVAFTVLVKIRKFQIFFAFVATALVVLILNDASGATLPTILTTAFTLYPLIFLGSIMLTEPHTMPTTRYLGFLFAILVGFMFAANTGIGPLEASPHLALLIGNAFAFLVSARASAKLTLVGKKQLTPTTYAYSFKPSRAIPHAAGQYMEFTMSGVKLDERGNRRTFTIASAPDNPLISIGVKLNEAGSEFKKKLRSLAIGDTLSGSHAAGDFLLPKDTSIPLVFIAGGIGITPFVAMIEEMVALKQNRQIDLYYFAKDTSELAYKDLLESAAAQGVTIHPKTDTGSRLTDEDIKQHLGAYFYLSGPPSMVGAYKIMLTKSKTRKIYTDLFTGY